jgi:hypothetical protein
MRELCHPTRMKEEAKWDLFESVRHEFGKLKKVWKLHFAFPVKC